MAFTWQERSMFSLPSTSGSSWSCAPVQMRHKRYKRSEIGAQLTGGRFQSRVELPDARELAAQHSRGLPEADPYTEWEYVPEKNSEYWEMRPVKVIKRAFQVGRTFTMWLLSSKLFGEGGFKRVEGRQAERLREILTELGPAFVKIGQAFSSRPDVVPPSFLRELEKLQDKIPPFPDAQAMKIIHQDLGRPASAIFSEISTTAVAAASLGQVYKARLRSTGQLVAVKVQRPNVRESIALDVYIMRYIAAQLGALRKLNSDLPSLLDEWATSLFRELDYRREAQNGKLFKELYAHLEGIYVPGMIQEFSTGRVLTIEWLDGVRLRSAGQSPSEGQTLQPEDMKLIEFGVQCSLEQMLEEGFYHADPHPGNLLRLKNGKLGYLDFGMMASIGPSIRRSLITATLHMVNREFEALASDFESLGLLPAGSQKDKVVPALAQVFEKALSGGVSNVSFGNLSGDLGKTMYEFKFRIPAYYTLLVRSLSVLEGIALSSDPNYKVLGAAYPWIARRLLSDPSPELQETLRGLLYKDDKFQFSRLESLLAQALRSPARIQRTHLSEPPTTTPDITDRPLELLLGKDGTFVRGIVLDELAKGIDAALRLSTDGLIGKARSRIVSIFRASSLNPRASGSQAGGSSLLTALQNLPTFTDKSDEAQVAGITRLIMVLQDVRTKNAQQQARPAGSARPAELNQAVVMLQWLIDEVGKLSPDARAEALRIPLSLGGRLSSRLLARAIKAFASREGDDTPVRPLRRSRKATSKAKSAPIVEVAQLSLTNLPREVPVSTPIVVTDASVVAEPYRDPGTAPLNGSTLNGSATYGRREDQSKFGRQQSF